MAIIKCKMCGGDVELAADKTFGTCEFCGNTMTFPKVDDDQRAAAFNRGNHFRRIGEFDKALAVYERIVREDDTDAEAHWCCALCRFGIEYVEDPATFEWLPTCHRASFDSFLEDVDYLAALENSDGITKRQYQKDAAKIAEVQRGILATSQNAEPYDVFICYKESDANGDRTRDSMLAQDIYYQLTEQGRKVFFARITLEDVVGTQYEPYIFAALNSAKVMIVVGTQPEYLNAVWVKNEWSRFLALMKKDRNKLLLPCYRDMDPYDLPEQLSVLQSYDMGKIGFIQDLIRGISKVLDAAKPVEGTRGAVAVQQMSAQNVAAPLLRRGDIALEDGDWDKAGEFFEEALNRDPECVDAYIGKALAEYKCATLDLLVRQLLERTADVEPEQLAIVDKLDAVYLDGYRAHVDEMVEKYVVHDFCSEMVIRDYYDRENMCFPSRIAGRKKQLEQTMALWDQNKNLFRAIKFEQGKEVRRVTAARAEVLGVLQKRLDEATEEERLITSDQEALVSKLVHNADQQVLKLYDDAIGNLCNRMSEMLSKAKLGGEVALVEKRLRPYDTHPSVEQLLQRCSVRLHELCHDYYVKACKLMEQVQTEEDCRAAKRMFVEIADYKDSMERARKCKGLEEEVRERRMLIREKQELESELLELPVIFGGKRRKEIETRLEEINCALS